MLSIYLTAQIQIMLHIYKSKAAICLAVSKSTNPPAFGCHRFPSYIQSIFQHVAAHF